MNRIRITQTVRACVVVLLALCFALQRTADGTHAAGQTGPEAADLILHHGFIWTVDESKPQAEAVAVRGDRIIKVGGNEEALSLRGEHTRLIDLKGIEAMTKANGPRDRRMRLVHAQVFAPRDFDRLKGLGVVAEVHPFHLSDDMRWMEQRIGHERCKGAYAFKTIQSKGATLSFGTDWPGASASIYPISPIYGLYAAVTRQTVRRAPAEGWFPAERLIIEEAIKAYTWGSAYASFEEKIKGTLTEGKLADVTVLDTNLLRAKPSDWIDERGDVKVKTLYTIVGGRVVYRR